MMRHRSNRTFQEEVDSFRRIPGLFWESPFDPYPDDPFAGIREEFRDNRHFDTADPVPPIDARREVQQEWGLSETGFSEFRRNGLVKRFTDAAKDDAAFADTLWEDLGIDIEEELQTMASASGYHGHGKPGGLITEFGTEALGTYCPWHGLLRK